MHQDRNRQSDIARAADARLRHWRVIGAAALAVSALGFAAAGCGSGERAGEVADAGDGTIVTVPAYETSADAHAASAMPAVVETQDAAGPVAGDGSMPPSILVTASSTVVRPGDVVDIAVQATPDVTEMSLWDGLHDRQALAYDADAKAWTVSYRVPLGLPWERTGLAITAKNESQRWCRSWVFLEREKVAPLADTAGVELQTLAKDAPEPGER